MTPINRTKSKSSLFLMEMIITLLFFSIASAVCVQLFAKAHTLSRQAEDLNFAVAVSQNFAEVMRGTDGTMDSLLEHFPDAEQTGSDTLIQYYNADFSPCTETDAIYTAEVTLTFTNAFQMIQTEVSSLETNEIIYDLSAIKYINTPQG